MMEGMRKATGPGEQAERDGRRKFWRTGIMFGGLAFVMGVLGRLGRQPDFSFTHEAAIFVAIGCPLLLIVSTWRLLAVSDERGRRHNIIAAVTGACFYILVYPSWLFLWMGRLAPEPSHQILFIATGAAALIGYIVPKLRGS